MLFHVPLLLGRAGKGLWECRVQLISRCRAPITSNHSATAGTALFTDRATEPHTSPCSSPKSG